jgi:hypothetical protein
MERLCEHLHEATTRYDHRAKRLDFFLVCPACRTERLIHSLDYVPCFDPTGTAAWRHGRAA